MLSSSPTIDPLSQPLPVDAYTYELRVVQQPLRARMCGFGEKDRRPCTPPPIVQLTMCDRATGRPVDVVRINPLFFTTTCTLHSADTDAEVDLIQQRAPAESLPNGGSAPAASPAADAHVGELVLPGTGGGGLGPRLQGQAAAGSTSIVAFAAGGGASDAEGRTYTVHNLIGTTVAQGAKLQGLDGQPGVFFVFPDLSIRKDGTYRLQFSFFNLEGEDDNLLTDKTDIPAKAFTDVFRVYSAKQFPGMMESTPLSKHFARQGVKIPVRKEAGKQDADPDL